jgi:formiminoglutamase
VTELELPSDPLWPRAADWFVPASGGTAAQRDLALLGVPTWRSSITPTGAHRTPAAVRDALLRYSTFSASHNVDVASLEAVDFGDVEEPDGPEGEARVAEAVGRAADARLLVALGGDNSLTYSTMKGLWPAEGELASVGLITVDAHHDLRDGISNGSPVRRLIEAGLPGTSVVQIGIADFSNSAAYAARARELGIHVITRAEMRRASLTDIASHALAIAGAGGRAVFVDIDVDVCDRAAVPGCPSAAPGGISADGLRQLTFLLARSPMVRGIDIAEIDADMDAPDQRTVRLAALLVLEAAAGLSVRGK